MLSCVTNWLMPLRFYSRLYVSDTLCLRRGQARVASVAYYNRRLIPTGSAIGFPAFPISNLNRTMDGNRADWSRSISRWVSPVTLEVLCPPQSLNHAYVSNGFLSSLVSFSRSRHRRYTSLESTSI